jgi:CheY-like chemotaxis protein
LLTIPLAVHATAPPPASIPPGRKRRMPRFCSLRILVVDDDEDIRFLVACLLEVKGMMAKSCESGVLAVNIIAEWKPDLIVSDIMMPEHDGYWLVQCMRQLQPEQGRDTPAIALTSLTCDKARAKSLSAGFQIHMTKHTMVDNLIGAIETLTRPGRAMQILAGNTPKASYGCRQ